MSSLRRCCPKKRRSALSEPFPHSAVVVIVMLMLIRVCDPSIVVAIKYEGIVNRVTPFMLVLLYVILPVLTLYADIKWGRFQTLLLCVSVSIILTAFDILNTVLSLKGMAVSALTIIGNLLNPLFIICHRCSTVILLSFGGDQLIAGSSEQLGSFIWWFYWCLYFGWSVTSMGSCGLHSKTDSKGLLYMQCAHGFSLVVIALLCLSMRRLLAPEKRRYVTNPLFLIAKVLNFARKNSYPLYRSALSYWDTPSNSYSRINLGKNSLGGPFLDEEVEDVKTFFRLVPLLICVKLISLPTVPLSRAQSNYEPFEQCLISSTYFILYVIAVVAIPLKRLVLKYVWEPRVSLLQVIGVGLLLSLLSKIGLMGVDVYVTQLNDNMTACSLMDYPNNTMNDEDFTFVNQHSLFLLPEILGGIAVLLILPTSLEFIYAQSPYSMRTLFIGMFVGVAGIFEVAGWQLLQLFRQPFVQEAVFGCEFYVFLFGCVVMLVALLAFLFLSKRYKLRERDQNYYIDTSGGSSNAQYGTI